AKARVLEAGQAEIEQQRQRFPRRPQILQHLRLLDPSGLYRHRLDFDDDGVEAEEVRTIRRRQAMTLVDHRIRDFRLERNATKLQPHGEGVEMGRAPWR